MGIFSIPFLITGIALNTDPQLNAQEIALLG